MSKAALNAKSYRSMPLDTSKRHIVFGDIHGRNNTFQELLKKINYSAATDIIYSVGDLIDRGADSVPVVEFFQQSHCHAVLGNHEQMVLNPRRWNAVWTDSWAGGRATLHSLKAHGFDKAWLTGFCASLPVCLDVGDEAQEFSFRLVHAECPLEWTDAKLMGYLTGTSRNDIAEGRLLWGRKDITRVLRALETTGHTGRLKVSEARSSRAVFCGHTPVPDVVSASTVCWIDTFAGGVMSCVDAVSKEIYQVELSDGDQQWL